MNFRNHRICSIEIKSVYLQIMSFFFSSCRNSHASCLGFQNFNFYNLNFHLKFNHKHEILPKADRIEDIYP